MGRPPPHREPVDSGYDQTYDYPGGEPNLPPDADIFDSGYEQDPTHAFEDPEEEPEEEIDNEFTRACAQGLRRLFQPRQAPREATGWAAPPPGHGPHDGEPYWGRTRTSLPGARGRRSRTPRPPPDETTGLSCGTTRSSPLAATAGPSCGTTRTTRTYRTAPSSPTRAWRGPSRRHRAPNDGGVPHCAQF